MITSLTLNCKYTEKEFKAIDYKIYFCNVTNLDNFTNVRETIQDFTGEHENGRNKFDVQGLIIKSSKTLQYPPKNVEKIFTGLIYISFFGSKICEILQSDLKPFPLLKYLYLTNNELRRIEKDIFEFNTDLELITLNGNKIIFIDPQVFSKLQKLRYLELGNNTCKLTYEYGFNATYVKFVVNEIENFTCTPAVQIVERTMVKIEQKIEEVEQKLTKNDKNHEKIVDYLMISFAIITVILLIALIIIIILVIKQNKKLNAKN